MQTLLTQHQDKNWFPERNYYRQYLSFKTSLAEQLEAIDKKARELDEKNELVIALHKHLIAVTAMLESQALVTIDDHRSHLDEPALLLNRTCKELFEVAQKLL